MDGFEILVDESGQLGVVVEQAGVQLDEIGEEPLGGGVVLPADLWDRGGEELLADAGEVGSLLPESGEGVEDGLEGHWGRLVGRRYLKWRGRRFAGHLRTDDGLEVGGQLGDVGAGGVLAAVEIDGFVRGNGHRVIVAGGGPMEVDPEVFAGGLWSAGVEEAGDGVVEQGPGHAGDGPGEPLGEVGELGGPEAGEIGVVGVFGPEGEAAGGRGVEDAVARDGDGVVDADEGGDDLRGAVGDGAVSAHVERVGDGADVVGAVGEFLELSRGGDDIVFEDQEGVSLAPDGGHALRVGEAVGGGDDVGLNGPPVGLEAGGLDGDEVVGLLLALGVVGRTEPWEEEEGVHVQMGGGAQSILLGGSQVCRMRISRVENLSLHISHQ